MKNNLIFVLGVILVLEPLCWAGTGEHPAKKTNAAKPTLNVEELERTLEKDASPEKSGDMLMLGWYYQLGQGVQKNVERAAYWFRRSLTFGNAQSLSYLASLYNDPQFAAHDSRTSFLLVCAAAPYLPDSQYVLGRYYEQGIGTSTNLEKAVYWLSQAEKSADRNDRALIHKHLAQLESKIKPNRGGRTLKVPAVLSPSRPEEIVRKFLGSTGRTMETFMFEPPAGINAHLKMNLDYAGDMSAFFFSGKPSKSDLQKTDVCRWFATSGDERQMMAMLSFDHRLDDFIDRCVKARPDVRGKPVHVPLELPRVDAYLLQGRRNGTTNFFASVDGKVLVMGEQDTICKRLAQKPDLADTRELMPVVRGTRPLVCLMHMKNVGPILALDFKRDFDAFLKQSDPSGTVETCFGDARLFVRFDSDLKGEETVIEMAIDSEAHARDAELAWCSIQARLRQMLLLKDDKAVAQQKESNRFMSMAQVLADVKISHDGHVVRLINRAMLNEKLPFGFIYQLFRGFMSN